MNNIRFYLGVTPGGIGHGEFNGLFAGNGIGYGGVFCRARTRNHSRSVNKFPFVGSGACGY
jgi:hypothetical protein